LRESSCRPPGCGRFASLPGVIHIASLRDAAVPLSFRRGVRGEDEPETVLTQQLAEAARVLYIRLREFGNIRSKAYEEETASPGMTKTPQIQTVLIS
jgi:hypothetical protein